MIITPFHQIFYNKLLKELLGDDPTLRTSYRSQIKALHLAFQHYNFRRGYGFVHYKIVPQHCTIETLCYIVPAFNLIKFYSFKKRCHQYEIQKEVYEEWLAIESKHATDVELECGKYILSETRTKGIRINVASLSSTIEGAVYVGKWEKAGKLTDGVYKPTYYTRPDQQNLRKYELGAWSYQCMPNWLKKLAEVDGQQNMDFQGCHKVIGIQLNPELAEPIQELINLVPDAKVAILSILNGSGLKLALEKTKGRGLDLLTEVKGKVKQLAERLLTRPGKLWKTYQRIEQEEIDKITEYLDSIGVGWVNMHDGLMVDQVVDYSHLVLRVPWIEKPLK